jgi:hypothetical protein
MCGVDNIIVRHTLSTPYDITTMGNSKDTNQIITQATLRGSTAHNVSNNLKAITLSPDGTKMMTALNDGNPHFVRWDLSTAWDLTTASPVLGKSGYLTTGEDIGSAGVSPDGKILWYFHSNNQWMFDLTTPWDLSTRANFRLFSSGSLDRYCVFVAKSIGGSDKYNVKMWSGFSYYIQEKDLYIPTTLTYPAATSVINQGERLSDDTKVIELSTTSGASGVKVYSLS